MFAVLLVFTADECVIDVVTDHKQANNRRYRLFNIVSSHDS
jgi:hypothetical protein